MNPGIGYSMELPMAPVSHDAYLRKVLTLLTSLIGSDLNSYTNVNGQESSSKIKTARELSLTSQKAKADQRNRFAGIFF
jgi:hypothetical protein